jgi:hypothetical protein
LYGGVKTSSYGGAPSAAFTAIKNTLTTIGDVIIRVEVTWNTHRVCSLHFFTLFNETLPPIQAPSCEPTYSTAVKMNRLLAFYDFHDLQLNAIGFHYVEGGPQ